MGIACDHSDVRVGTSLEGRMAFSHYDEHGSYGQQKVECQFPIAARLLYRD